MDNVIDFKAWVIENKMSKMPFQRTRPYKREDIIYHALRILNQKEKPLSFKAYLERKQSK
jgi:hypothetical protein